MKSFVPKTKQTDDVIDKINRASMLNDHITQKTPDFNKA